MKKKKKKRINKIPYLIILIILIVGFKYLNINEISKSETYIKLENIGYNKEEITNILKLDEELVTVVTNRDYEEKIYELINEEYFILSRLDRYINLIDTTNIKDVIELVNTDRDYSFYNNINMVDLSKDYLVLVNKYHNLDKDYVPSSLVNVLNGNGQVLEVVNSSLTEMTNAAKELNLNLFAQSNYRSYARQEYLYNNYVKTKGQEAADRESARPGHSEHQTGLAVDFIIPGQTLEQFYLSNEFLWLKDNSYKYGFILRYPEDKENITGYIYEPWHYRYVGKEVAQYIYENDITFDEYYAFFIEE
jgi:zinc D-Ala-D-Ala carboxypeptidase